MSKVKKRPSPQRSGLTCPVIIAGALLLAVAGGMIILGLILLGVFGMSQAAPAPLNSKVPPEVVAERRASEEARLNSYGWVDQEAGLVHIPISQAMALVAGQGLPVGEPTATPTPTALPTPTGAAPGAATPAAEPSPTPTPAPTVDLANVSFQNHVLPIFEQHCTRCHGGEEPKEGLRLTSYAEVIAGSWNGTVIEPGDVENSYLIEQVVSGRMPKEGPKLTPAEIEIITAWVEAGAPDN